VEKIQAIKKPAEEAGGEGVKMRFNPKYLSDEMLSLIAQSADPVSLLEVNLDILTVQLRKTHKVLIISNILKGLVIASLLILSLTR